MKTVHHAGGVGQSETFLVNISLPNSVNFKNVEVTFAELPAGVHMLIGMDIITAGDFSITNVGGVTVFSFRLPSQVEVDFVKELQRLASGQPAGASPKQFGIKKFKNRRR
jgi:hypothetical protein